MMELSQKVHGASLGYHGNIALKQNGGQDKYSYFYNIFGSGASSSCVVPRRMYLCKIRDNMLLHIISYLTQIYCI